jgi:hypothetical protein
VRDFSCAPTVTMATDTARSIVGHKPGSAVCGKVVFGISEARPDVSIIATEIAPIGSDVGGA